MWAVDGEVDRPIADVLVLVAEEPGGLILNLFANGVEVSELLVRQMSGKLCIFLAIFGPSQVQQQRPSRADARASWKEVSTNLNRSRKCDGFTYVKL